MLVFWSALHQPNNRADGDTNTATGPALLVESCRKRTVLVRQRPNVLANPISKLFAVHAASGEIEHQPLLPVDVGVELEPVQGRNTSIAACATRLLPSTKG